ncbi:MAG: hypothetical protein LBH02_00500, partial [Methanocalculaceae archaeon]|nr:hypothetical protein [Methanocalculaceae archaeon]
MIIPCKTVSITRINFSDRKKSYHLQNIYHPKHAYIHVFMADTGEKTTSCERPVCARVISPQIDEGAARDIVRKWICSDKTPF